jgi:hypothetical protein
MIKYKVNEKFFENWNPDMAYILGFIAADGYLNQKHYRLEFSCCKKDINHLKKIKTVLQTEKPIIFRKKYQTYSLRIDRKKIIQDLNKLGIKQNKSLTINWLSCPDYLVAHMIRGYFDGDGHINLNKTLNIEILGTENFLQGIEKQFFKNCNLKPKFSNIKQKNNIFRLRYSGFNAASFCEWIYSECGLKLTRKYLVYKKSLTRKFKEKSSVFFGVCKTKKSSWQVACNSKYLGLYDTEIEAAIVDDKFVIENNLNKKLNFPKNKLNLE